jgi:hypothetical protein
VYTLNKSSLDSKCKHVAHSPGETYEQKRVRRGQGEISVPGSGEKRFAQSWKGPMCLSTGAPFQPRLEPQDRCGSCMVSGVCSRCHLALGSLRAYFGMGRLGR